MAYFENSIYTSKAYNKAMRYEFIESSLFSKMVYDYFSEDDYAAFQQFLLEHPQAGDVVQGSGGVRKLRWARAGTGKSAGVRVCYYTRNAAGQILLLVIYAKSVRASIPGAVLKQIKEVLDHDD
jgi:hypothetical protein